MWKPPEDVRGMMKLNRDAFTTQVTAPGINLLEEYIQKVLPLVKPVLLKLYNFKPIDPVVNNGKKRIWLDPEKFKDSADMVLKKLLTCGIDGMAVSYEKLTLTYDNWKLHEILQAVLPDDKEVISSYSLVGHIAHVNLRDHQLPFKDLIGQVVLDKLKNVRTVVNKVTVIENTFRNFAMEVLAGDNETQVCVKENHCSYEFDFAKVYWNPRLSTEHERLVEMLKPEDVLCDVFAGVGPFAIPAAKKGCTVHANDLNPESVKWLKRNVDLNKVQKKVSVYNLDGLNFITDIVKFLLVKFLKEHPGTVVGKFHIVMNLPAMAVDFLDAFKNLLCDDNDLNDSMFSNIVIHVYCFTREADKTAAATLMVEEKLGCQLNTFSKVRFVRNVAPGKDMMLVSFCIPREVLTCKDTDPSPPKKMHEVLKELGLKSDVPKSGKHFHPYKPSSEMGKAFLPIHLRSSVPTTETNPSKSFPDITFPPSPLDILKKRNVTLPPEPLVAKELLNCVNGKEPCPKCGNVKGGKMKMLRIDYYFVTKVCSNTECYWPLPTGKVQLWKSKMALPASLPKRFHLGKLYQYKKGRPYSRGQGNWASLQRLNPVPEWASTSSDSYLTMPSPAMSDYHQPLSISSSHGIAESLPSPATPSGFEPLPSPAPSGIEPFPSPATTGSFEHSMSALTMTTTSPEESDLDQLINEWLTPNDRNRTRVPSGDVSALDDLGYFLGICDDHNASNPVSSSAQLMQVFDTTVFHSAAESPNSNSQSQTTSNSPGSMIMDSEENTQDSLLLTSAQVQDDQSESQQTSENLDETDSNERSGSPAAVAGALESDIPPSNSVILPEDIERIERAEIPPYTYVDSEDVALLEESGHSVISVFEKRVKAYRTMQMVDEAKKYDPEKSQLRSSSIPNMYFPVGWPKSLRTIKGKDSQLVAIACNRDRFLFSLVYNNAIEIWFYKPCVPLVCYQLPQDLQTLYGDFHHVEWRPDSSAIAVTTMHGYLVFFNLFLKNKEELVYMQHDSQQPGLKRQSCELYGRDEVPSISIRLECSVMVPGSVTGLVCLRDELMVATGNAQIHRYLWDGSINRDYSLDLRRIPFCVDKQV
ncbi:unnamed protein product, partial [Darwinula stevensoni]